MERLTSVPVSTGHQLCAGCGEAFAPRSPSQATARHVAGISLTGWTPIVGVRRSQPHAPDAQGRSPRAAEMHATALRRAARARCESARRPPAAGSAPTMATRRRCVATPARTAVVPVAARTTSSRSRPAVQTTSRTSPVRARSATPANAIVRCSAGMLARVAPRREHCPICGSSLADRRSDAQTCSPRCRRELWRLRAILAGNGPLESIEALWEQRAKPAQTR